MVYRFIIVSRSTSILGMIEQFVKEVCALVVDKFQSFAVSDHFLQMFPREGGRSAAQTSLVKAKVVQ